MQRIFLLVLGCCLSIGLFAQDHVVHFAQGDQYFPSNATTLSHQALNSSFYQGRYRVFIQFDHLLTLEEQQRLQSEGIQLLEYIPNRVYTASLPGQMDLSKLQQRGVRSVQPLTGTHKMSARLSEKDYPTWAMEGPYITLSVQYFQDIAPSNAKESLRAQGASINLSLDHVQQAVVQVLPEQIEALAAQPFVRYVDLMSEPGKPESDDGRHLHRANAIDGDYSGARNYDGTGITFAINDDGFVGPHIDFKGRVNQDDVAGDFTGNHGDMVAGIAGGAGNLDPSVRGMATGSYLFIRQYVANMAGTIPLYQDSAVLIFSSSYSNGCNAGYTTTTNLVDQEIYTHPFLMQTFSAGNSNNSDCGYGAGNQWGNITGGHKMGKNVIATANLDLNDVIRASSSRGPANDGRIKPDISAHGHNQMSTDPNNGYSPGGGTSAAAPGICGVMAQLHHAYQVLNAGNTAPSALLKATMLVTANDLGNDGPDFTFGWGKVNGLRAVKLLEDGRHFSDNIAQGGANSHNITIPAGVRRARIMVYWADPGASPSAATALVNNLDATVTNGGTTYQPWLLNSAPNPTTLALPAVKGIDSLNNVEEIAIDNPAAGTYVLNIAGTTVPMGSQQYYVVYDFLTEDIDVIHPMGGEGIEPNSSTRIHWDAYGTAGTFNVEYSTDNGATWNTINGSVPGDERFITWNTPATVSGQCLVRVTRGAASDQSEAVFTLMERPENIRVTRACTGTNSIRLVWDAVPNATSYDVFVLGAKFMDSVLTTSTTSADVPVGNINDEQWFSVRAVGANGLRSQRQIAVQYAGVAAGGCLLACSGDNDAGVTSITSPSAIVQSCVGPTLPVTVNLENLGLFTETNFPVYYQLDSDPVVTETVASSLAPSGSLSYTFTTALPMPSAGNHILRIWTGLQTDSTTCNDTLEFTMTVFVPTSNFPILEDYESGIFPPAQAFIENPDGARTWELVNTTGANGAPTSAMRVNGFSYNDRGQEDIFGLAVVDLTTPVAGAGAEATFDVAYRRYSNTYSEELRVEISTDCGATYTPVYTRAGNALATGANTTANWAPASSGDWRNDTVDLSAYVGNTVLLRWVHVNDFGNNVYVDNINVNFTGALPPAAAFRSDRQYTCDGTVAFSDLSANQPLQWRWDFGDGDTSNVSNPTHTYTSSGVYNVTLQVTNNLGVDSEVKNAYIEVELAEVASVTDGMACPNTDMDLNATALFGDLYWFDSSGTVVHTGGTYTAPGAATTTAYQVRNVVTSPLLDAGPASPTAVGGGGYHGGGFYGVINFTASRAFDIVSVWVDANGAGPRTITLWDGTIANGGAAPTNTVLQTTTVNLDSGAQRIRLDFAVPGPGSYSIGGNNMDLFRNNSGVNYPYTVPGVLSMNSSGAGTPTGFYYYLYDWKVRTDSCVSAPQTVTAEVVEADFSAIASGGTAAFTDASIGATSWLWRFGDGDSSTVQNPTHTYTTSGSYVVTLTINNNACSYTDTVEVIVSVNEINDGMEVVLLPNPATSSTHLRFGKALTTALEVKILAANGQTIRSMQVPAGTTEQRLDISDLPAAVYWVRLQSGQAIDTRKLIVR